VFELKDRYKATKDATTTSTTPAATTPTQEDVTASLKV